jgi:VCBS repeat-containing protein
VLGNDTDADGDPLTAFEVKRPSHGTLTLNADGSFNYEATDCVRSPDSFIYKATDGTADSYEATVTINFDYDNPAPHGGVRVPC